MSVPAASWVLDYRVLRLRPPLGPFTTPRTSLSMDVVQEEEEHRDVEPWVLPPCPGVPLAVRILPEAEGGRVRVARLDLLSQGESESLLRTLRPPTSPD